MVGLSYRLKINTRYICLTFQGFQHNLTLFEKRQESTKTCYHDNCDSSSPQQDAFAFSCLSGDVLFLVSVQQGCHPTNEANDSQAIMEKFQNNWLNIGFKAGSVEGTKTKSKVDNQEKGCQ